MNETPANQPKTVLTYGLILGFGLIATSMLFYLLKTDLNSKIPSLAGYAVLLVCLALGIKARRDQNLGGYISYGKSLGTGLRISLIGAVLAAIYVYVFFTVIDPSMIDRILDLSREKMADRGLSDDQVEKAMEMTRKFMTPTWMFLFSILSYVFAGFIFSLIISIFTKREENPFKSTQLDA